MTLSLIKERIIDYSELIRLNKPIGFFLLLVPCYLGIALSFSESDSYSFKSLLLNIFLFTVGSFLMRSFGCVVNDYCDRDIDLFVFRTQNRPLAQNRIKKKEVLCLSIFLLSFSFLIWFFLNTYAQIMSVISLIGVLIYPKLKRYTYFPQVLLGLIFNSGLLVSYLHIKGSLNITITLIYCALVFWAIGYDTIYAFLDIEDDAKLNLKSTALFFKDYRTLSVGSFYVLSLAFWLLAAFLKDASFFWYVSYFFVCSYIFNLLKKWSHRNKEITYFNKNFYIGIFYLLLSILISF
jgi:4-hydroxybenzoate polyprenyltransferase